MKIKYNHIFWGSFFIFLGILYLLKQITQVNLEFHYIKNFWPIFIISIGLFYLNLPRFIKYIISSINGLLVGLMLFSFLNTSYCKYDVKINENQTKTVEVAPTFKLPIDSAFTEYFLNIDYGAGELKIFDKSIDLIEVYNSKPQNLFTISKEDSIPNHIDLSSNTEVNINDKILEREGIIKLNPEVVWNLDANLGAVSSFFDLSDYKIRTLNINSGASSIGVKIGERLDSSNINIECGASKIEVLIPYNSGCIITTNSSLSKNRFKDFKEISEDTYQTENYLNSVNKIHIFFEGGVSKFIVKRY